MEGEKDGQMRTSVLRGRRLGTRTIALYFCKGREDLDPCAHLIHYGSKMPARCRCTVYGDAEICFSSEFIRTQSVCRGHSFHFLHWLDEESGSAFPGSPANLEPRP